MSGLVIIYPILVCILFIFSLKNLVVYFVTKEKTYISMFFILLILISMIIVNRYLTVAINDFEIFHSMLDIINVTLISGAVVYFSHYFLKLKIINQLTLYYFYFLLLISVLFITVIFMMESSLFLSSLHHFIVFFYCILLIAVIIYNIIIEKRKLSINRWIRIATFIVMMLSFIGMTIYKILMLPMNPLFYIGILVMIFFIEIELIFKIKIQEVDEILKNKLSNIDEKDRELISYIIDGLEYKEIAKKTGKTLNTVRKYIHLLYQKYEVSNKTELLNKILKE